MKKFTFSVLFLIIFVVSGYLSAQTADGGIFGSGTTLTVKFKPSSSITGTFTSGNLGIRWLHSLGANVNLGIPSSSFGYSIQQDKTLSGLYDYIVYGSGSMIGSTTYTAGTEYTLMSVTVTGGVGTGSFELCPGGFAGDAGVWYIELGGADRANATPAFWYYASTTTAALPVELTSFTATTNISNVDLKWSTATEVNNYGFEVEKSIRNEELGIRNWEKIGFVKGNGNSNSSKDYSFVDKTNSNGKYVYRLKQIDNDGKYQYSKEVEVEIALPTKYSLEQNYPNPFNPTTKIRFELPKESNVTLRVFNLLGEEVATLVNKVITPGRQEVTFDGSKLSSGMYIYRIEAGNFVQTKKLLLMK